MSYAVDHGRAGSTLSAGPHGLKVSPYERVASLLLAGLLFVGVVVGGLFMVWLSSKVFSPPVAVPVTMVEIPDAGGGYLHGVEGEDIEIPGPVTADLGSGLESTAPELEQTLAMVSTSVAARKDELDDPRLKEPWSTGGIGGVRGTGNAPSFGEGGGSGGGVRRGVRWIIEFEKGSNLETYAKQLDFFGVELGSLGGVDEVQYAAGLSQAAPVRRAGVSAQEDRLYFSWQDGALQEADRQLLGKAGIDTAGKIVVQFYPAATEQMLAVLEADYLKARSGGRDIKAVRRTRFGVRSEGQGYVFFVINQTYLPGK